MRTGVIAIDGKIVGYIDVSIDEGSDEEFSVNPDRPMHRFPDEQGLSPGGPQPSKQPRARGHGPLFRPRIGPRARPEPEPAPAYRGGPTFRPGIAPRGKAPPAEPEHFTVASVRKAIEGRRGIDRSEFSRELDHKPWLRDKIMRIAHNEQGAHPEGTQAIIESMMNRAQMRHTDLETQAKWTGERGYYAQGGMGRGALENPTTRAVLEKSLQSALGGSNVSNFATDNSSGALAARERASGAFQFRKEIHGETFFAPGAAERSFAERNYPEWLARAQQGAPSGRPEVVTRLGADPSYREPVARVDIGTPITAQVPTGTGVNLSRVNPEIVARLNQAYRDAPADSKFRIISGYRPATRAQARALGMSERSSQEDIWERSDGGRRFMAAPPVHSQHQSGEAVDIEDPSGWFHRHAREYGLWNLPRDYPHFQLGPHPQNRETWLQPTRPIERPEPKVAERPRAPEVVSQNAPRRSEGSSEEIAKRILESTENK